MIQTRIHVLSIVLLGFAVTGCDERNDRGRSERQVVVVYTALDRGFSEPILDGFTRKTGIEVRAQYDTESTKTVGLVNRIRAERNRPRCDVFWNNEIVNTIRLKKQGLIEPCNPPEAAHYPSAFRDPQGYWYGFAARARVIIVNTDLVPADSRPMSIFDLTKPEFRGRVGIAKPLFGTTASHVACLFSSLGEQEAEQFLKDLKGNEVRVLGGNKRCATDTSAGRLAFALTDTDDAVIELEAGRPVAIIYPDSGPDGIGTLFIPNTLALVRDGPNPEAGKRLINYLLSPSVEEALAKGASAQIPLHKDAEGTPRVRTPREIKAMKVDFNAAAEASDAAREFVEEWFLK